MAAPEKKKTSMGMDENVESGLSYVGLIVTGLIFYFSEKDSKLVKFHALQSIVFSIILIAVQIVVAIINAIIFTITWNYGITSIISLIVWLAILAVWIFLVVKAFMGGNKVKLPVIGDFCEKKIK